MDGRRIKIAPSIIAADWSYIYAEIEKAKEGDFIHVDVMDGHFVPNITLGPDMARVIYTLSEKPLDIHLMLEFPERYIRRFAFGGVFRITFHYESSTLLSSTIKLVRSLGKKVGIAISPDTPVKRILKVLNEVDQILVMTVYPGFSGQKLIERVIPKIYELASLREDLGLNFSITADGGINWENLHKIGPIDEAVMGLAFFEKKLGAGNSSTP